jgi:hypothetical protein
MATLGESLNFYDMGEERVVALLSSHFSYSMIVRRNPVKFGMKCTTLNNEFCHACEKFGYLAQDLRCAMLTGTPFYFYTTKAVLLYRFLSL